MKLKEIKVQAQGLGLYSSKGFQISKKDTGRILTQKDIFRVVLKTPFSLGMPHILVCLVA